MSDPTCMRCQSTNMGCLNVGTIKVGQFDVPLWLCQGCIKHQLDFIPALNSEIDMLRAANAAAVSQEQISRVENNSLRFQRDQAWKRIAELEELIHNLKTYDHHHRPC